MSGRESGLESGGIDWARAYDNRAAVANAAEMHARFNADAAAFRERTPPERLTWGIGRQTVDLYRPEGAIEGLAVFIHGGYWHRNTPETFSHLAAGALARRWAVAQPGYRLCPDVRIRDIVQDVARGIEAAADAVPEAVAGPIRISGHSAGGHLASRMITPGALSGAVLGRVAGVLSISGLHDLRPLMRTPLQDVLHLDGPEAQAESPALLEPAVDVPVTAWVGANELAELRRQTHLLATVWGGLGLATRAVEDAGHDHFTVIEGLADPGSPVLKAWIGL